MVAYIYPPTREKDINPSSANLTPKGSWNADTNAPTLVSSVGIEGEFYTVSVAGTTALDGISDWQVGDWALFASGVWNKTDNSSQWVDNGSYLTPLQSRDVLLPDGKKFLLSTIGEIFVSGVDFILKSLSATGNIITQLGDALGATSFGIKDSLGAYIFQTLSSGITYIGKAGLATITSWIDALGVTKITIDATKGIINKLGSVKNVTVVSSATYTILETDRTLSIEYVGDVTLTLPTALDTDGREYKIVDKLKQASTYPITIKDDAGTPNTLFTIASDGDTYDIEYITDAWEVV